MPHPASAHPRPRGHQVNGFQLIALLLAFVLVAGVGGVLAAGLFIPVAAGAKALTDTSQQVFDDLPTELTVGTLPQKSVVYANDGKTVIAQFYDENRTVVPLSKVSDAMQQAVVAIEDKRFYEHGGIDITGTVRALVNNATGNDTQGASTLTQQYVKNVLIENALAKNDAEGVEDARAKTTERKLREAKLAISLEKKMSKDDILAGYLNIAQFGSRVYGVEAAAQYYFSTSASKLNALQAATIAGVTQAPNQYDPVLHPDENQRRRNIVLNDMYQQGYITKKQYDEYRNTKVQDTLKVDNAAVQNGCVPGQATSTFCDYITTVIKNNDDDAFSKWGKTADARMTTFIRGGYKVVTTLDVSDQKAATKEIRRAVPVNGKKTITKTTDAAGNRVGLQLEGSVVSVVPGTGEIRAMAQNTPFDASESSTIKGSTSINFSTDYAHGGSNGFQPGSSFKPYVLAEWLKSGHSLYQTVNGARSSFPFSDFHSSCGGFSRYGQAPWTVRNSDGTANGSVTVLHATADSINRAYASMATQLDLCDVGKMATTIGWKPSNKDQDSINITPSMILGTQQTSPLAQATAYATFASGGTRCDAIAITSITTAKGKDQQVPSAHCDSDALDPSIANTITYALEDVVKQGGTAPGNELTGRPSAGKTGTAQGSQQTWFVGYTPQLSTAVWIGNAQGDVWLQDMTVAGSKIMNGAHAAWLYGGTLAAPTWKAYMDIALKGEPAESFDSPDWTKVTAPQAPKTTKDDSTTDDSKSDDSKSPGDDTAKKSGDSGSTSGGDSGGKTSGGGSGSSGGGSGSSGGGHDGGGKGGGN